ncbi:hypothetical protein LSH36_1150g00020 [Paralvinella palmiformis]|uniref:Uncharacterized protein n=1 Tax=Paralvinella palmiformis TaxID=53620 RepID=A0AAD9IVS5_9ANNE|nr:hypothetical protein LSH36_1150g00020 [Paralvinella palmiformis]
MAAKLLFVVFVAIALVGWTAAYPPMYNRQFTSQFPRLFQAACLVKNATSGEVLQNEECSCGDQTVACDVGPIAHYGMEMTFCNKLDDQSDDQLYILQFGCLTGEDQNCGTGTFCDIGPLTYGGTEYFICRFASSVSADVEDMCKPDVTFTQPPAWGLGRQFGRGAGRWVAMGGQGNPPQGQPGMGRGWRWNQGNMPVNPQQNLPDGQQQWQPGMGPGWRWNQGTDGVQGSYQGMPAGGAQPWGQGMGRRGGRRNW